MLCRLKFYFKGGISSVFWGLALILYISRAVPSDLCFTNINLKTSACCKSDFDFLPPRLSVYFGDEGGGGPVVDAADGQSVRRCVHSRGWGRHLDQLAQSAC